MSVEGAFPVRVHWEEGQLLHPHHFQQLQRAVEITASAERSAVLPYPGGLLDIAWDATKLQAHELCLTRLHLVMPGGDVIRAPEGAMVSELSFRKAFERNPNGFLVHVAVPKLRRGRANAFRPSGLSTVADAGHRRFRVEPIELHDENESENKVQIESRRDNVMLMVDGDSADGFDTFPLLRIHRRQGDVTGAPRIDPQYAPASLTLRHALLAENVRRDLDELLLGITKHIEEAVRNLDGGGYSPRNPTPDQLARALRVACLCRLRARLIEMIKAPCVHPWMVYLEVLGVRYELAAMDPIASGLKHQFGLSADDVQYRHDDLAGCFRRLRAEILDWLGRDQERVAITVLSQDEAQIWVGPEVSPEQHQRGIYLGIACDDSQQYVVDRVREAHLFKVAPRAIFDTQGEPFGLPLEHRWQIPVGFPARREGRPVTYFEVKGASANDPVEAKVRQYLGKPWVFSVLASTEVEGWEMALYVPIKEGGPSR